MSYDHNIYLGHTITLTDPASPKVSTKAFRAKVDEFEKKHRGCHQVRAMDWMVNPIIVAKGYIKMADVARNDGDDVEVIVPPVPTGFIEAAKAEFGAENVRTFYGLVHEVI